MQVSEQGLDDACSRSCSRPAGSEDFGTVAMAMAYILS